MKSKTSKKLASYLGLATVSILSANAGIIYTDINPDTTLVGDSTSYDLDLNNDSTANFTFMQRSNIYSYTNSSYLGSVQVPWIVILPNNELAQSHFTFYTSGTGGSTGTSFSFNTPIVFNASEDINNNNQWTNSTSSSSYNIGIFGVKWDVTSSSSSFYLKIGNWENQIDKYVGLRIKVNGDTLYGWVRLDIDSTYESITIKDYAYEDSGESIKAGEGSPFASIKKNTSFKPKYNVSNQILTLFNLSEVNKHYYKLNIINTSGKLAISSDIKPTVDLSNLNNGIYIIQLIGNNDTYSGKIKI